MVRRLAAIGRGMAWGALLMWGVLLGLAFLAVAIAAIMMWGSA